MEKIELIIGIVGVILAAWRSIAGLIDKRKNSTALDIITEAIAVNPRSIRGAKADIKAERNPLIESSVDRLDPDKIRQLIRDKARIAEVAATIAMEARKN